MAPHRPRSLWRAWHFRLQHAGLTSAFWSARCLGPLTVPLAPVRRLRDQVFGVVGLGRIGTTAALRTRAFGMRVVLPDPDLPPGTEFGLGIERAGGLDSAPRREQRRRLHCRLNAKTTRLSDDAVLQAAKPGLLRINTTRGGIVDLDAVERALRSGHLVGAGLDVLPVEPLDRSHPLIAAWTRQEPWLEGRLLLTPHAAFDTPKSLRDMRRRLSAQAVADFSRPGRFEAA